MAKQSQEGRATSSRDPSRKRPQDPRSPTARKLRRRIEALDRAENPDLEARAKREAALGPRFDKKKGVRV